MKKLSIYQYEGTNIHDLILTDLNTESIELAHVQGLRTHSEITSTIDTLITTHNMQPEDKIVNYVFDQDEYLKEKVNSTVKEYQQ